ncbi:oligosaccharide repeat unit polymerase [Candidatus Parcubacteria bacterium]|nr:oligosaccharide repeat unit polymerase [Candidatus Parcubacteria bacterium]
MNNQINNNNKSSIGEDGTENSSKIKHEESNKNLKKILVILGIFLFFLICSIFLLLIINNSNSLTHNSNNNGKVSITGVYHNEYEGTKYWGSPCYLEDDNGDEHAVNCLYDQNLGGKKLEIIGVSVEPKKVPDNYEGAVAGDYWPGYIKILDYSIKGIVCVKEGKYADHLSKDSFECCNGLSKASALPMDDNCEVIIPKNSPGAEPGWVCINCGDGNCNKYENKCNCPEDCLTQTDQAKMIYSKESAWGPCANPEGGCWQKEYLYQDGKHETVTMDGTNTKTLNKEAIKMVTDYIKSSDLLTDTCEYSPVLDLAIYYTIRLYDKENKITFPGCEDKLNKLDKLIEINSLETLDRQKIIEKAKVNLHNWLNEKDYYQVNLDELELQHLETPVCKYNNRQPIRTGSCWSVGYPGINIIDEINNIDDTLEKLYYISFEIERNHQSGCGLVGGEVLITNRGRIIETDEIELCIDD